MLPTLRDLAAVEMGSVLQNIPSCHLPGRKRYATVVRLSQFFVARHSWSLDHGVIDQNPSSVIFLKWSAL